MAAATDLSTLFPVLEGGYNKENGCSMEDQHSEVLENFKQMKMGKPPRHLSVLRHCMSSARLVATELNHAMVLNPEMLVVDVAPGARFSSRVFSNATSMVAFEAELDAENGVRSPIDGKAVFLPIFRSGSCSEIGPKPYMEDEHVCIDNLVEHLSASVRIASPGAFYGVFDGHGGLDAAAFVRKNILKFIVEDAHFPTSVEKAIRSAFVNADHAFADTSSLDISSGTTALTALIFGRTMLVANVGDCRAVLGKRGRAVELSKDHKPNCTSERLRIEKLGGVIYDGYLNGQLSVARALGDWHMKGAKGSACPLSADPELQETILTEDDEFLIIGCDGLWDVMTSQCAVTMARRELMLHNDPERCSRELVREALKRNTCDNLTVVVVCFSPDPPPRIEIPRSRFRRSISAEGLNFLKGVLDSDV